MAWIKSIFKKGKKKVEELPQFYNAFFQFNHENIIQRSESTENVLKGSLNSPTLYLDSETGKSSVGIIATGNFGCQVISVFDSRFGRNIPDTLILSSSSDYERINTQLPFIEIPSRTEENITFYQGKMWWEQNKERLGSYLDRLARDKSLIYIFPDNNAFNLGVVKNFIEYLKNKGIQVVIVFSLPFSKEDFKENVAILAFIYELLKKGSKITQPFILIDNSILIKENSTVQSDKLLSLIVDRLANTIIDLIIGSNIPSIFYLVDNSSFNRIFRETKGPCKLLSLDIYDNNADIISLFEKKLPLESFKDKKKSMRGFVMIQPGPKGLKTSEYRKLRSLYANTDVVISILPSRESGAIIRGVLTYNSLPKSLLNKYDDLSGLIISSVDESGNDLSSIKLSDLEQIIELERYRVSVPVKPTKE